jgi:FkbM family methyltransferase
MLLAGAIHKLGTYCHHLSGKIYRSPQQRMVNQWTEDRGDETLRLDYDLDENSMVFDLGGYEGQWASDIFSRYCCSIYIFEPVAEFAKRIEQKFRGNKKIFVHNFGLAHKDRTAKISVNGTSSSLYKQGNDDAAAGRFVRADEFMHENKIKKIDLMKINIEGGEYDLVEHLIETGFVHNIRNIQVQFHDFVPQAQKRMGNIQNDLQKTHSLTYQYLFVWENWRLRGEE